jgi:hypothetical protein
MACHSKGNKPGINKRLSVAVVEFIMLQEFSRFAIKN